MLKEITYDEAKIMALKYNPNIKVVKEFEDAYWFHNKGESTVGGDTGIVITKQGKVQSMSQYCLESKLTKPGKSRKF